MLLLCSGQYHQPHMSSCCLCGRKGDTKGTYQHRSAQAQLLKTQSLSYQIPHQRPGWNVLGIRLRPQPPHKLKTEDRRKSGWWKNNWTQRLPAVHHQNNAPAIKRYYLANHQPPTSLPPATWGSDGLDGVAWGKLLPSRYVSHGVATNEEATGRQWDWKRQLRWKKEQEPQEVPVILKWDMSLAGTHTSCWGWRSHGTHLGPGSPCWPE